MMEEKELPIVETKSLTYLCRFDKNGRRGETHLSVDYTDEQKAEMITNGFVEIDEEEWALYCEDGGNKYIRVDGKPTLAPPHVPTNDELLSQLENEYATDKAELMKYYTEASLVGDSEVMAELKNEMTELEADYETRRKEIEEG